MKGLIVGFGFIAEGHLVGYRSTDDVEIVAAVDISERRREAAVRAGLRAFATVDEALAAVDVDFLDICTPPTLHLEGIRAANRSGLAVLCEKPVFVPGDSAHDDVVSHAWRGESLLYPCQNYKFAPIFSYARTILDSGAIGDVRFTRIDIARRGHARGVQEWHPDWRRDPVYSAGGILRDHGPHAVYLLLSLVLHQLPLEVSVLAGCLAEAQESPTTEDTVLMRVRSRDAVECDVSLSWTAGQRSSRYLFVGNCGFVSVDNDVLTWSSGDTVVTEPVRSDFDDPSHSAWFADMLADFLRLSRAGRAGTREAWTLVAESLRTTAVIDTGYESFRSGGTWIPVPDVPLPGLHVGSDGLTIVAQQAFDRETIT